MLTAELNPGLRGSELMLCHMMQWSANNIIYYILTCVMYITTYLAVVLGHLRNEEEAALARPPPLAQII